MGWFFGGIIGLISTLLFKYLFRKVTSISFLVLTAIFEESNSTSFHVIN